MACFLHKLKMKRPSFQSIPASSRLVKICIQSTLLNAFLSKFPTAMQALLSISILLCKLCRKNKIASSTAKSKLIFVKLILFCFAIDSAVSWMRGQQDNLFYNLSIQQRFLFGVILYYIFILYNKLQICINILIRVR